MSKTLKAGAWTRGFGADSNFERETKLAIEIGAKWESSEWRRCIALDPIPGWLEPLWGSDKEWLYIRRPEGVWKTRIPSDFHDGDNRSIMIYCRANGEHLDESRSLGGEFIGPSVLDRPGWICGLAVDDPIDAATMDARRAPATWGCDVDADELVYQWGRFVREDHDRLVLTGGDAFAKPPAFTFEGGWLIGADVDSGRRVVFQFREKWPYHRELRAGRISLSFRSLWLPEFLAPLLLSK